VRVPRRSLNDRPGDLLGREANLGEDLRSLRVIKELNRNP
jgi:hypothetical protein